MGGWQTLANYRESLVDNEYDLHEGIHAEVHLKNNDLSKGYLWLPFDVVARMVRADQYGFYDWRYHKNDMCRPFAEFDIDEPLSDQEVNTLLAVAILEFNRACGWSASRDDIIVLRRRRHPDAHKGNYRSARLIWRRQHYQSVLHMKEDLRKVNLQAIRADPAVYRAEGCLGTIGSVKRPEMFMMQRDVPNCTFYTDHVVPRFERDDTVYIAMSDEQIKECFPTYLLQDSVLIHVDLRLRDSNFGDKADPLVQAALDHVGIHNPDADISRVVVDKPTGVMRVEFKNSQFCGLLTDGEGTQIPHGGNNQFCVIDPRAHMAFFECFGSKECGRREIELDGIGTLYRAMENMLRGLMILELCRPDMPKTELEYDRRGIRPEEFFPSLRGYSRMTAEHPDWNFSYFPDASMSGLPYDLKFAEYLAMKQVADSDVGYYGDTKMLTAYANLYFAYSGSAKISYFCSYNESTYYETIKQRELTDTYLTQWPLYKKKVSKPKKDEASVTTFVAQKFAPFYVSRPDRLMFRDLNNGAFTLRSKDDALNILPPIALPVISCIDSFDRQDEATRVFIENLDYRFFELLTYNEDEDARPDCLEWLRQWAGQLVSKPGRRTNVAVALVSPQGETGKSTFVKLLRAILGNHLCAKPDSIEAFLNARFKLEFNKPFVDLDDLGKLPANATKRDVMREKIYGKINGDTYGGEIKGGSNNVQLKNVCNVMLCGNQNNESGELLINPDGRERRWFAVEPANGDVDFEPILCQLCDVECAHNVHTRAQFFDIMNDHVIKNAANLTLFAGFMFKRYLQVASIPGAPSLDQCLPQTKIILSQQAADKPPAITWIEDRIAAASLIDFSDHSIWANRCVLLEREVQIDDKWPRWVEAETLYYSFASRMRHQQIRWFPSMPAWRRQLERFAMNCGQTFKAEMRPCAGFQLVSQDDPRQPKRWEQMDNEHRETLCYSVPRRVAAAPATRVLRASASFNNDTMDPFQEGSLGVRPLTQGELLVRAAGEAREKEKRFKRSYSNAGIELNVSSSASRERFPSSSQEEHGIDLMEDDDDDDDDDEEEYPGEFSGFIDDGDARDGFESSAKRLRRQVSDTSLSLSLEIE